MQEQQALPDPLERQDHQADLREPRDQPVQLDLREQELLAPLGLRDLLVQQDPLEQLDHQAAEVEAELV